MVFKEVLSDLNSEFFGSDSPFQVNKADVRGWVRV